MPKNNRPGTFFGDWDPQWNGSTQTERKLAQNQYDIEEQLEILNDKLSNLSKSEPENSEPQYVDYAFIANVDRDTFVRYINSYNEKVSKELLAKNNMNVNEVSNYVEELDSKVSFKESDISVAESSIDTNKSMGTAFATFIDVCVFIVGLSMSIIGDGFLSVMGVTLLIMFGVLLAIQGLVALCNQKYVTKIETTKKEIKTLKNKKKQCLKNINGSKTYVEFYNFRLNHYNKYMEHLIDEYLPPLIKSCLASNTNQILKSKVVNYGNPIDYMTYLCDLYYEDEDE